MVALPMQKIILEKTPHRGGIITMPGILAMNSSKNRTSPVLRGIWTLEKIMGQHLAEPPMDVGVVKENKKGENLSFRERFEAHRSNKTCAVCHDKIDPLGFALESYNPQGYFRLTENEKVGGKKKKEKKKNLRDTPIDASGQLPNGDRFKDYEELKELLKTKHSKTVIRNIVKRFMTYALCRKLELYDQPEIDRISEEMYSNNGTYRQLIVNIATSLPFTHTVISEEK